MDRQRFAFLGRADSPQADGSDPAAMIEHTRNVDHLRENLSALDLQLTSDELRELDAEFAKLTVHGGRMNEMQMQAVERAG
jgi:diketogulonate reductase-like aldo/keto reductase